jgi:phosphatidylserine/phosphatidylglycerophosphate/cardiolipin synthase-like enzyme
MKGFSKKITSVLIYVAICASGYTQVEYFDQPVIKIRRSDTLFAFKSVVDLSGRVKLYDPHNVELADDLLLERDTFTWSLRNVEPSSYYFYSIRDVTGDLLDTGSVISPSASSGSIRVYFNYPVETSLSTGILPLSESGKELFDAVISYIDNARSTVDLALYNNNRIDLVEALNRATERGVRVRYIADDETGNSAIRNSVLEFPVVFGNPGDPLMHHKFIVIDQGSVDSSWVITGSTNMTTGQIATDPNNLIAVQDRSLAMIFTREFEEMWGSNTELPDPDMARFGSDKLDDTPHQLQVGGVLMDVFFSPSDETEAAISRALETADHQIESILLLITSNGLGDRLLDEHLLGTEVRMLVNNINAPGSEFDFLQDGGVDIHEWPDQTILHHKYAIIDPFHLNSRPMVVTGSHNWTFSADNINDENTLIIKDPDIANVYAQEFAARWCQAGLEDCLTPTFDEVNGQMVLDFYPNPVRTSMTVKTDILKGILMIYNQMGIPVLSFTFDDDPSSRQVDLSHLPNGSYVALLRSEGVQYVNKLIKL